MNPFKFKSPPVDQHDGETQWADNWLSNAMAFVSINAFPSWCDAETHWTSRVSNYLFTDCPCCAFFRGTLVGGVIGAGLVYLAVVIIHLLP